MENQIEPIAKRIAPDIVEYVCPTCGWYDLSGVFREFLRFVDHLIQDYCFKYHPMLSQPLIQANGIVWFRKPGTNELILGLPVYRPDSPDWKVLLDSGQKLLPQAKWFLPDIADWLAVALISLNELCSLQTSSIITADKLVSLISTLEDKFQDQKNYLLRHEENLKQVGMDPKWLAKPGNQPNFVARSMAGARWGLTSSTSREMIRSVSKSERKEAFLKLKIPKERGWWEPQ